MKRFVDLRRQDTGYRFAWFDTVTNRFERHGGEMAWNTFAEFEKAYVGTERPRYRGLCPKWAFVEETEHMTPTPPDRKVSAIVHGYLREALEVIDAELGEGEARKHPALVAAYVTACAAVHSAVRQDDRTVEKP